MIDKPTHWNIDCDVLLYAVGFAVQTQKDENGDRLDEPVLTASLDTACNQLLHMAHGVMEHTGAKTADLILTGEGNYRLDKGPPDYPYKGNRKSPKPLLYHELREFAIGLEAVEVHGAEADDWLAHRAVHHGAGIATIDKDLLMVPGWHYNWNKQDKGVFLVSPEEGMRFFYRQLLTGDMTDNIPGLYKMTGKKAMPKVMDPFDDLDNEQDMFDYAVSVYEEHWDRSDMTAEEFVVIIGNLLWMDINWEGGWQPPSRSAARR